jgi:hypothetical protein
VLGWLVLGGCHGSEKVVDYFGMSGTVASLSPGGAPTLVSLQWLEDEGVADTMESGGSDKVTEPLPASFAFRVLDPTRFAVDFDQLRALPACPDPNPGTSPCWDAGKPRPQGRGKLAVGTFLAFVDGNGNGQYDRSEPLRGLAPLYVLYARDLDAQAIKELGENMVMNPQLLIPGYNYAHVRCKDKVGWKGQFDPFELVGQEEITVESLEAIEARLKAADLCTNWT